MGTTFTNISSAQLDDMVVESARSVLPLFKLFSIALESGPRVNGNVVRVMLNTDPTVGTKTLGTMTTDTGGLTGVDVTINTPLSAGWKATEGSIGVAQLVPWWQAQINGAVYGVAKAVIDAALALFTATNFGNTDADKMVVAPGDFGWADYARFETLADVKIKRTVGMLLNAYYAGAIRAESTIMQYAATLGQNLLATGGVPTLGGQITPVKYVGLPTNSENLGGIAFGKAAVAGIVAPYDLINGPGDGDIVERRIITEPDSGLSLVYTSTATGGGTRSGEIAALVGVAKGDATAAVRLLSA